MQAFVSESQRAAELEEKRRYRFLAEKHLLLSNTFLQFFGRVSWGQGIANGALLGTVLSASWLHPGCSFPSTPFPLLFLFTLSIYFFAYSFLCLFVSSDIYFFVHDLFIPVLIH